jgi:hypothetical protein
MLAAQIAVSQLHSPPLGLTKNPLGRGCKEIFSHKITSFPVSRQYARKFKNLALHFSKVVIECRYILLEVYSSWHMLLPTLASAAALALTPAPWALSPRALTTTSSATPAFPAALALALAPWALSLRANF